MKPINPNIIGKIIVDREGFEIGEINDLIKNTSTGEIEEFVLKPTQHYRNTHDIGDADPLIFSINDILRIKNTLILEKKFNMIP